MSSNRCLKRIFGPVRRPWLMAVCLAVHCDAVALADIAPDPLSGGKNLAVKGREATNVAMVDEVVKLRLSKDTCHVDVVFTMKNTGAKPETMQVGFPHHYKGELKEFKAAVDDKAAAIKDAEETRSVDLLDGPGQRPQRTYWKLWEMTFPPEKPVKITVSYSTKLAGRFTWTVASHAILNTLCDLVPIDDRAALEQRLISRNVEYILKTGGHWSGPIARCRIEVTFEGMTSDNLTLDSPNFERARAAITRDKLVWDLKDYEPKRDVRLRITPGITRQGTRQLLEKFHKSRPHDPILAEMLAEYLIAADRQPEADKIVLELLTHWQDKIAIWGPDSERGQTLSHSANLFALIRKRTIAKSNPYELGEITKFQNPTEFAPVVERIANRVKSQMMEHVPPNKANMAKHYVDDIEQMLEWSRKHAKHE